MNAEYEWCSMFPAYRSTWWNWTHSMAAENKSIRFAQRAESINIAMKRKLILLKMATSGYKNVNWITHLFAPCKFEYNYKKVNQDLLPFQCFTGKKMSTPFFNKLIIVRWWNKVECVDRVSSSTVCQLLFPPISQENRPFAIGEVVSRDN